MVMLCFVTIPDAFSITGSSRKHERHTAHFYKQSKNASAPKPSRKKYDQPPWKWIEWTVDILYLSGNSASLIIMLNLSNLLANGNKSDKSLWSSPFGLFISYGMSHTLCPTVIRILNLIMVVREWFFFGTLRGLV